MSASSVYRCCERWSYKRTNLISFIATLTCLKSTTKLTISFLTKFLQCTYIDTTGAEKCQLNGDYIRVLKRATVSGMPPQYLRLIIGVPVMLLIGGDQGLSRLISSNRTDSWQDQRRVDFPRIPLISDVAKSTSSLGLPNIISRCLETGVHRQFYLAPSLSTSLQGFKIVFVYGVQLDDSFYGHRACIGATFYTKIFFYCFAWVKYILFSTKLICMSASNFSNLYRILLLKFEINE